MKVYNISKSYKHSTRGESIEKFITEDIAQILAQYDNVSLLSSFKSGDMVKILFDIGFDNVAFGIYCNGNNYSMNHMICKKMDTQSLNALSSVGITSYLTSNNGSTMTFNCTIRIISRDNKIVALNIGKASIASDCWFVLDKDNNGRPYVMFGSYACVYLDNDDSYVQYQLYNANSAMSNTMEGVVVESLLHIYNSNVGIVGMSTNLKSMVNVNLPTTKGSVIDVAGVKYVAMDMKNATAHQNVWVYDKEYGL